MNIRTDVEQRWITHSWFWLILLVPPLAFSNGRWQLAFAALATPFFARLFLFSQPAVRGLLILLPVQIVAYLIMWWEVIPAPGVLYYVIAAAYGLCYLLPFVIDRVVSIRIAGFASTLVLPLSWYLIDILIQIFTPYGSWSSVGYTQMGHGLLTPLAAWVGVAGVGFVTIWIGSVASWLVMTTTPRSRQKSIAAIWLVSVFIAVAAARIPLATVDSDTSLAVAAITPSNEAMLNVDRAVQAARSAGEFDDVAMVRLENVVSALNDELFERTRSAARDGARLIVWSETAARALGFQEDSLVARAQRLAREEGIYLFVGFGVLHPGKQPPYENKVVAIGPTGEVAWHYRKAQLAIEV